LSGEQIGSEPTLPYLSPELNGERLLVGANFASAGIGILNDTGIQFVSLYIYIYIYIYCKSQSKLIILIILLAEKKNPIIFAVVVIIFIIINVFIFN